MTLKLAPVTGRGRRQEEADQFPMSPLCLPPPERWRAANDLPRPALLPRSHARDPQAAAVPRERGPRPPHRDGAHARQVRHLLPLLLAATYQTVPTCISKVTCFQHKLPKIIFLKEKLLFGFFFLKFYFLFFFFLNRGLKCFTSGSHAIQSKSNCAVQLF